MALAALKSNIPKQFCEIMSHFARYNPQTSLTLLVGLRCGSCEDVSSEPSRLSTTTRTGGGWRHCRHTHLKVKFLAAWTVLVQYPLSVQAFFSSSYNSRGKRLALQLLNVPPASQASCLICPIQPVVVGRYFIHACLELAVSLNKAGFKCLFSTVW